MEWTRRRLVGTTLATAALAGCLGDDGSSGSGGNGGGNESDGGNGDANDHDAAAVLEDADLQDYTGQDSVAVTVDPDGGGFTPETFEIDADTVLEWSWEGSSTGLYPLDLPPECYWDEEDNENDEWESGDTYDRLFWAPGDYLYASRDADGEEFTGAFRVVEADDSDGDGGNESEDGNESEM